MQVRNRHLGLLIASALMWHSHDALSAAAALRTLWPTARNAFKSSYESFLVRNPRLAELFFSPKAIKTNIALHLGIGTGIKGYEFYQEQNAAKPTQSAIAGTLLLGGGLLGAYGLKRYLTAGKNEAPKKAELPLGPVAAANNFYKNVLSGGLAKLDAQALVANQALWETLYKPILTGMQNTIIKHLFDTRKKTLGIQPQATDRGSAIMSPQQGTLLPGAAA